MKRALIVVFFIASAFVSKAQYSMDFGLNLGGSTYIGEIRNGGSEDSKPFLLNIEPKKMSLAVGGFYRYNFTDKIAARFSFNWVRIAGADSLASEPTRIGRNLSFRTDIYEFALMGEYNFITIRDLSRRSRIDFQTGVLAGIGYSLFYPYAQLDDKWYSLRPLNTEGVENAYDEGTLIVPLGINAAFTFNKKIRLGMEFVYRFTFTDYLDDISTDYAFDTELPFVESRTFNNRSAEAYARGNEELPPFAAYNPGSPRGSEDTNDGYFLIQANISYVIFTNSFYKARYNSLINRRRKRTKF